MIDIEILNSSSKPIYQQLFDQISSQIIKGELIRNYSLPPIRTAAKELRVSIITVKKAWEELERRGLIYTMVGRGCFVADLSSDDIKRIRNELISNKLGKDIIYYKELGLTLTEIIELVRYSY
jgi:GntR family transcriptional regulator